MSLLADINASYLGQFLAFVGIGSLIDSLIGARHRETISRYIFRGGSSLKEFEVSVITGLIQLLTESDDIDKLSLGKIFFYSLGCSILTLLSLVDGEGISWITSFEVPNPGLLFLVVPAVVVAVPYDFYSIWVTKRIFYYRPYSPTWLPALWMLDVCLSLAPILVTLWAAMLLTESVDKMTGMLVMILMTGVIGSAVGSVLLSAVQLIVILSGLLLRGIMMAAHLGERPGAKSIFERVPVSICFLTFALILVAADLAGDVISWAGASGLA